MPKQTKITPLADRVLIEPLSEEERTKKTKTGIIIPDTVRGEKKVDRGHVVAVGPGRISEDGKKIPMNIKKDQLVVFSEYSSEKIKVDDKEYFIISESNILAVIE